MSRSLPRAAVAFLLLLLAVAAACDGMGPGHAPVGPDASTPLFQESEEDAELATEDGYTGPTRAAAWIGSSGGSLSLAGHSITVPEGAVSGSMCFTMELGTGNAVDVDLNAWQMDSSEGCKVEGDGSEGGESWEGTLWQGEFEVPVTLALTYSRVNNVDDPSDLQVAWLKSSTDVLPLSSSIDATSETVWSQLEHFSMYALIIP